MHALHAQADREVVAAAIQNAPAAIQFAAAGLGKDTTVQKQAREATKKQQKKGEGSLSADDIHSMQPKTVKRRRRRSVAPKK